MAWFLIGNSITLTLVFLLIVLLAYYTYYLRKTNIFRRIGIPGPAPVPIVGELFTILRKGMYKHDVDRVNKYGKVVGIYGGALPIILLADADLLRKVLIKDSHIFINRRVVDNTAGPFQHGLTSLKDEAWKNARSIVSPTFTTAKLKAMFSLMDQVCDNYNKRLLEYADSQEMFDIKVLNGQFTLDNIASCLFGIETNSLQNENRTLINHLRKFFAIDFKNIFLLIFIIMPPLARYLGKRGYSFFPKETVDYTANVVNQVLSRRRQGLERRNDFIQMMVDREEEVKHEEDEEVKHEAKTDQQVDEQKHTGMVLKKTLSDKEILSQAMIFLVAGYETTSVLMSFFFYAMATEPQIQEKVYEEIRQELGDDEITLEKLNQLHYLDMVINETLRKYPPFLRFDRVASEDYQLGDYLIPKGINIQVPIYPIHHDPVVWPDPEKFIPERFTVEEKAKRHPMSFLPFGDGPRNCIGMRFALIEAKLGIAKALREVEIQKCEKTEIPLELGKVTILSSRNPMWLRAVRRSK